LVETVRVNGKSRQRHLYYLGGWKTPDDCLAHLDRMAGRVDHPWFVMDCPRYAAEAARLRAIVARGEAEREAKRKGA
jgi:hypothetical protein